MPLRSNSRRRNIYFPRFALLLVSLAALAAKSTLAQPIEKASSKKYDEVTQEMAIEWANTDLIGVIPSLVWSADRSTSNLSGSISDLDALEGSAVSESGSALTKSSSATPTVSGSSSAENGSTLTPSKAINCLYTEDYCQCKQIQATRDIAGCLEVAERDEVTGRSICRRVDCHENQGYMCDCAGDQLCTNDRANTQRIWRVVLDSAEVIDGSLGSSPLYSCYETEISGAVVPMEEPESLDSQKAVSLRAETTDRTGAWNATHCACTAKINLVQTSTCFDLFRPASKSDAGTSVDLCRVRNCSISPAEMVCDMMTGTSLCERSLVYTERFRASPGVAAPAMNLEREIEQDEDEEDEEPASNFVPCHKESGAIERPQCVSSCER